MQENYIEKSTENTAENVVKAETHTDNAEKDGCNIQSEKLFTQGELEALISERMKRERKNARSLNSIKELLNTLKSTGVIKEGSYSDMACQLVEMFSADKENTSIVGDKDAQKCGEDKKQAQEPFTPTCEISQANGILTKSVQDEAVIDTVGQSGKQCADTAKKQDVNANELFMFKRVYPEADLNAVFSDEAFLSFAKGRNGTLHEIYRDYTEFAESFKRDNEAFNRRVYSHQGSTAFSSDSKAYTTDYAQRLTRRQMDIANSCGMSYREYTELLSSIPNSPKRNLN